MRDREDSRHVRGVIKGDGTNLIVRLCASAVAMATGAIVRWTAVEVQQERRGPGAATHTHTHTHPHTHTTVRRHTQYRYAH